MWTNSGHNFYRRSYRSAPPRLVPAIMTCQLSLCLIIFGVFFLITGCVVRFVAGDDSPPKPPFDDEFFTKAQKEHIKTPRTIGMVLLIISSLMIGIALIGFIISCVLYGNYERDRRAGLVSSSEPHSFVNPSPCGQPYGGATTHWPAPAPVPAPPMQTTSINYPPQPGFNYPSHYAGYSPVSQTLVYNPTTEPDQPIIPSRMPC